MKTLFTILCVVSCIFMLYAFDLLNATSSFGGAALIGPAYWGALVSIVAAHVALLWWVHT